MESSFWITFGLSLKLATVTTVVLLILSFPITYFMHFYRFRGMSILKAIITLPLVLPPTVLGYYLLLGMNDKSAIGGAWHSMMGQSLAFSFEGMVIGSVVYSLPFMINPVYTGLEGLPEDLEASSFSLGMGKWKTYTKVLVPNIKLSLLTAIAMTFAHTVGEFGVILMIGGSIEGKTKVASIAIYEELEALNFDLAGDYAILLLAFAFLMLLLVYSLRKRLDL